MFCKQRGRLALWLECGQVGPPTRRAFICYHRGEQEEINIDVGVRNDQPHYKIVFQAPKTSPQLTRGIIETQTALKVKRASTEMLETMYLVDGFPCSAAIAPIDRPCVLQNFGVCNTLGRRVEISGKNLSGPLKSCSLGGYVDMKALCMDVSMVWRQDFPNLFASRTGRYVFHS